MRLQFFKIIFFCIFFLATTSLLNAQPTVSDSTDRCDSIDKKSFFKLAKKLQKEASNHKNFSDSESVTLVKLYNTITGNKSIREDELNTNNFLGKIITLFNEYYFKILKNKYELQFAKGGALYLKKIDMCIGVTMTWRCKDFFWVY